MRNPFSKLLSKAGAAMRRGRAFSLPPSPEALALEAINPLRGIGVTAAQDLFDAARRGNFATLGRVYAEIESADPTLLVVSERRNGALADLAWRMKDADGRARGFDAGLAREQAQAAQAMLAGAENFGEAVEHLATAFFRGSAHAQPRFLEDGTLVGFACVPLEMVCYDASRDLWQLNPGLSSQDPGEGAAGLVDVPPEDGMVSISRRRHVDYPALMIYVRAALGERHWGRFVDRFGLPPAALTMPPMASAEEEAKFLRTAKAAADGRTVALPNGSSVTYAEGARGVNPFSEYLRHQQELVVLMATGGLLTTLAESGSGTLAGGAHQETWRQVVRKDARILGEAIQAQLVAPWLRRTFPGRPVCSVFDFDAEPAPTASEVLDDAVKARQAGYEIDAKELSEKTGYTLKAAPQAPAPGGFGGGGLALNRKTPLQFGCDPLQNARKPSDGEPTPPEPAPALKRVLEAFRSDLGPAAEELRRVLALPEAEMRAACRDLAERLPDLLPEDPAMASILAEELAGAFSEAVGETGKHGKDGEVLTNSATWHKCPKCGKFDGFNGHCGKCGYTLSESGAINRAKGMLADAMSGTMLKPVTGIAYRDGLGQIDLEVGRKGVGEGMLHGTGLSKLRQKHEADIPALAEALVKGEILQTTKETKVGNPVDPDRRCIVYDSYAVYLARKEKKRWRVSTIYKSEKEVRKASEIAKEVKSRK